MNLENNTVYVNIFLIHNINGIVCIANIKQYQYRCTI